jgi:hypothetical protein
MGTTLGTLLHGVDASDERKPAPSPAPSEASSWVMVDQEKDGGAATPASGPSDASSRKEADQEEVDGAATPPPASADGSPQEAEPQPPPGQGEATAHMFVLGEDNLAEIVSAALGYKRPSKSWYCESDEESWLHWHDKGEDGSEERVAKHVESAEVRVTRIVPHGSWCGIMPVSVDGIAEVGKGVDADDFDDDAWWLLPSSLRAELDWGSQSGETSEPGSSASE